MGEKKLGQPVPESNFVSELNSGSPQHTQWYTPGSFVFQYLPVNAGSVPASRVTWYCSGDNFSCHSFSVFAIFSAIVPQNIGCAKALKVTSPELRNTQSDSPTRGQPHCERFLDKLWRLPIHSL